MNSISNSSNLRIGGLASGIDTDSIIKNLMKVKRMPVDKLKQEKQILNWQQEDYRGVNSTLRGFRDKLFDMKLQSTYLVNSASSSNETAVSASANSNAKRGIYSVSVTQLANAVSKGSQETLLEESNADGTIKTLAAQFSGLPGSISFTLEGTTGSKSFTFDTSTATIYSVASEINAANLGISASYDATLNRFFLNTTTTGSDAKIKISDDNASHFLSGLDGSGNPSNILKLQVENGTDYAGKDAIFNFGDMTGLTSATNSPTVNGITLSLKQEGASGAISVTSNTDAVFNTIKDFVSAYNDTLAKINDKLSEIRYRDYPPLTDEQRDVMSEKDIEKWEEFARSGLLKNDPLLNGHLEKMRTNLYSSVSGLTGYKSLAEIGITTGSYMEKGKLYLDETKLKEALQKDPEGVMNLFTKSSDNNDEKGIAARLYDNVNNAMSSLAEKAGNSSSYSLADNSMIGKSLTSIDKNIKTWEDRLKDIEDRFWRQFSAMEEAISRMNSQSAWLSQQLGASSN